jgi:hypothetical protein
MIAITTSNSISVNPRSRREFMDESQSDGRSWVDWAGAGRGWYVGSEILTSFREGLMTITSQSNKIVITNISTIHACWKAWIVGS